MASPRTASVEKEDVRYGEHSHSSTCASACQRINALDADVRLRTSARCGGGGGRFSDASKVEGEKRSPRNRGLCPDLTLKAELVELDTWPCRFLCHFEGRWVPIFVVREQEVTWKPHDSAL